jgi:hypothetical protein
MKQQLSQRTFHLSNLSSTYGQGVMLTGFYSGGNTFVFELIDPRGANPPFGKTTQIIMAPNEIVIFWAAQPYFVPPQPENTTVWSIEVKFDVVESEKGKELINFENDLFAMTKFCN